MEWLADAKACLNTAYEMLQEIADLQEQSLSNDELIPYLKVKIKNFLENCRSPLDYAAYYAFETYCKSEYIGREKKKFKVYFPIRHDIKDFNKLIAEQFKGLQSKRPEVLQAFENAQSFKSSDWLRDMNRLLNKNKHRYLTKQNHDRTSQVHHMEIGVNFFIKGTFTGNGTDMKINGQPYNFGDSNVPSEVNNLISTTWIDFKFTDLNKSVLPTLKEIYLGARSVINHLEKVI